MGLGEGHGYASNHEIPESRVIREAYNSEDAKGLDDRLADGPHQTLEFPTPGVHDSARATRDLGTAKGAAHARPPRRPALPRSHRAYMRYATRVGVPI